MEATNDEIKDYILEWLVQKSREQFFMFHHDFGKLVMELATDTYNHFHINSSDGIIYDLLNELNNEQLIKYPKSLYLPNETISIINTNGTYQNYKIQSEINITTFLKRKSVEQLDDILRLLNHDNRPESLKDLMVELNWRLNDTRALKKLTSILRKLEKDGFIGIMKLSKPSIEDKDFKSDCYYISFEGSDLLNNGGYGKKITIDFINKKVGFWLPIGISFAAFLFTVWNPTTERDIYELSQKQASTQIQLKESNFKLNESLRQSIEKIENDIKNLKKQLTDSTKKK